MLLSKVERAAAATDSVATQVCTTPPTRHTLINRNAHATNSLAAHTHNPNEATCDSTHTIQSQHFLCTPALAPAAAAQQHNHSAGTEGRTGVRTGARPIHKQRAAAAAAVLGLVAAAHAAKSESSTLTLPRPAASACAQPARACAPGGAQTRPLMLMLHSVLPGPLS